MIGWGIFWLIFCVIVGVIADSRGRFGFGWFLLSILITPLLALILVALLPNLRTAVAGNETAAQTRPCPFCAEPIRFEAIKCKHCGSTVPAMSRSDAEGTVHIAAEADHPAAMPNPLNARLRKTIAFLIGAVVIAVLVALLFGRARTGAL